MGDVGKGVESGFVATIVISILLYLQQSAGLVPEFNLISLLMKAAGTPGQPMMGWMLHFVIGAGFWGGLFSAFSPHLPGPHWFRGLVFGLLAWVLMMVAFLPAAGLPVFALGMGSTVLILTLSLNLIFGLVMGETYHLLLHYLPSEVDENA